MKISFGQPVENQSYFDRPALTAKFYTKLRQSKHLSIVAPRRVGKTSFMKNLVNHPDPNYVINYIITESLYSASDFFEKIYQYLISIGSKDKIIKEFLDDQSKKKDIKSIGLTGVEFEKNQINYYNELSVFIAKSKFKKPIILLIDEFSQTLQNIIEKKGESEAKLFLHQCRELRIMQGSQPNVHFIYTGSIGLENLVASLDESKAIIDLTSLEVPAFTIEETKSFIKTILDNDPYVFPMDEQDYFIDKLNWLLPFYIQVIMSEIETILIDEKKLIIERNIIDQAWNAALKNRTYFIIWKQRLKSSFKSEELQAANEILDLTSTEGRISLYDLQNIYKKYGIESNNELMNILVHDGYLTKFETQAYRFNSPLLENWWKQNL